MKMETALDLIPLGLTVFGLGFAGWAFALKRALAVMDRLGNTLSEMSIRQAIDHQRINTVEVNLDFLRGQVFANANALNTGTENAAK